MLHALIHGNFVILFPVKLAFTRYFKFLLELAKNLIEFIEIVYGFKS